MRSSLTEPHAVPGASTPYPSSSFQNQRMPAPPPQDVRSQRKVSLAPAEGWLPLFLLTIAVYSVVYSVTLAISVNHNSILWMTTAFGLLLGLVISKVRYFPQIVLHIASCIAGYWLALFLTSFLAYHISVLTLLSSLRDIIANGFTAGETQNSDLVFLFYLSFLCFFLGYFGSWLIYRAHLPWLVAFVYIAITLVNLNYVSKSDPSFLVVILVGSLILLIARVQLANQLIQWKSDGLYTDQAWLKSITARFLQIALLFLILILPLSSLVPIAAQPAAGVAFWNGLDNAWDNIAHGRLPTLNHPNSIFSAYNPPANFFGDQLTIAGNVNLPSGPVLSYTSSSPLQGQYLESFTFNTFDGHTWTSQGSNVSQAYSPNALLPLDAANTSPLLTTSVTVLQPPGGTRPYIFAPPQPEVFNVPITLLVNSSAYFASTWTQTAALTRNEVYQVKSEAPDNSPSDLAAFPLPNKDPGQWIADANFNVLQQYYMQTPSDLSPEVLATEREWTAGATSAYDAVVDLQTHLSNPAEFKYSLTNPPVPTNIDAVTWLLHTHQGYCTYYATAMAIMARLLNIPTRVVNGFSTGHYDTQQKAWIVDGSDAHSWVQVYFPGKGWVSFDPTPGFSQNKTANPAASPTPVPTKPTAKPTPTPVAPQNKPGAQPTPTVHQGGSATYSAGRELLLVIGAFLFIGLFMALFVFFRRRRARYAALSPAAAIYARLCDLAGVLGSPPAFWQTPYEYTFSLSRRFPQASQALRHLADLFVRERWASPQQKPNALEKRQLDRLWSHLRTTILRPSFREKK